MMKEVSNHKPVAIYKKYNTDTDKPVPVVNIPPARFIGGPSNQERTGKIQGSWYPDISLTVVIAVGVLVEEAL